MIILPDFLLTPYALIEDKEINPLDERVYSVIYWYSCLKNEKCTASNATIASICKSTAGSVANSLDKLEARRYIKRLFKDAKRKVRLEIIPLISYAAALERTSKRVSSTGERVSPTDETYVSPTDEQNKKILNKNNKEELVSIPAPSAGSSEVNLLIDKFKEVNPSYKLFFGRPPQRKALERLVSQFGPEYVGRLIDALPAIQGVPYAPTITSPCQLEDKLAALKAFYQKEQNKINTPKIKIFSVKDYLKT